MKCGRSLVGVCLVVLGLAACTTSPPRAEPYNLPQYAEADSQCRDIGGSYRAVPHPLDPAQQEARPLLALTLLPPQASLASSMRVALEREDDGALQVMALGADGRVLAKRRYAADSGVFDCSDGQLAFFPRKLGAGATAIAWDKVILRRTEDGSLILRKGGLFSGLVFMVFPMYVSTDDWYLFKPAP